MDSAAARAREQRRRSEARLATGRLAQPESASASAGAALPDMDDLASRLRFGLKEGRIWFDTQRVCVIHLSTLAGLRREMADRFGPEEARGVLTRMGYSSGWRDATMARKLRPDHTPRDAYLVGPQLRTMQGIVRMSPERLELDVATGRFQGEFTWTESFEVDAQLDGYGLAAEPVCWMQVGYACGYTSAFMGRTVLFREVECRGAGARQCRIIGKPLEEWDDIGDTVRALQPEAFANRFAGRRREAPAQPVAGAEVGADGGVGGDMVGVSSGFVAACHMLRKVGRTEATVLFLGETGVGKEMFARTLHQISRRADKPFVAVNCAAIPESLVEAELFGVERGAFTGATHSRPGRFERADGGTLFLDEVGTLTLTAQVKLLRVLQQKEIERVGDTRSRKVDVRIVAATNVDLDRAVARGEFRDDLLFRLKVFPILVPPLRDRRDDIPLLIDHFLHRFTNLHGRAVSGFTARAVDALYEYDYPGNIRELENMIERAVILTDDGQPIDTGHLFSGAEGAAGRALLRVGQSGGLEGTARPQPVSGGGDGVMGALLARGLPLERVERELMEEAVSRAGGNLAAAARLLGMTRPQLAYRLRRNRADS